MTPARLLVLSFLALIALGTVGFMVLPGLYVDEPLSWLDALFTATSAVCVTGLIVVDTATYFTRAGQAYILLLIQLGGLGILTFATLVILALGKRLSLQHEAATAKTVEVVPEVDFKELLRNVVRMTFLFEGVGAILLFAAWLPRFTLGDAAWHAVFQAVSAFCNAGFSTFSDSLMGFRDEPVGLTVVMALIVLGGLGFLTLEELRLRWGKREEPAPRLSLHSRLVLSATGILLLGGWLAFTSLEWGNTLGDLTVREKLVNGLFMSVTARTAGFNTVDHAAAAESTNFFTILLMSIGGSPSSTAGGLKTTTVAVIGLLALARLRGRRIPSAHQRTIPEETVQRAVGLFVVGFIIVTGGILLYAVFQLGPRPGGNPGDRFLLHMFEAVSAFNTVGLSMGATGDLTPASKFVTITLMYVGRVSPLTFVAAIALRKPTFTKGFRYAYEDVIIG